MSNTSVEASYRQLVRYYDAEHVDLTEDLSAYDLLAARFAGHVLDVGCGTGRVSVFLAEQGYLVTGVDSSVEMLAIAQRNTTDGLSWHLGDIRSMQLAAQFSLAIFSYNGFSHLLTQQAQLDALKAIRNMLVPGGAIAIDMANPLLLVSDDSPDRIERRFADLQTGHTITQRSQVDVDPAQQMLHVTWIYADEVSEEQQEIPMQMRYVFAPEMQLLLQMSGYGQVEQYGTYDFDPYQAESLRLLTVAQSTRF